MSNWISVKDKLPEEAQTVWLTNGEFITLGSIYTDNGEWCWGELDGDIHIIGDEIVAEDSPTDLDVTHWMELPKVDIKK